MESYKRLVLYLNITKKKLKVSLLVFKIFGLKCMLKDVKSVVISVFYVVKFVKY